MPTFHPPSGGRNAEVRSGPPSVAETNQLHREIASWLEVLFGHSAARAAELVGEYNRLRDGEWRALHGPTYHDDELLHHQGARGMAYIVQWMVELKRDIGGVDFLDWRRDLDGRASR